MRDYKSVGPVSVALLLIVGLIGGFAGAALYGKLMPQPTGNGGEIAQIQRPATVEIKTEKEAIVDAVAKAEAAVVKIVTETQPQNLYEYLMQPGPMQGIGSGFFFEYEGKPYVMTNSHVVSQADRMTVELIDGQRLDARLVGAEDAADLAVLELVNPPKNITYLELGDSAEVKVGEWVIAMGNPFGYTGTITVGVVSANRYLPVSANRQRNVIQTDAAINKGNSGGPLVNLAGQAIGVNFSIFTPNQEQTSVGIGWAIPINEARSMAHFLIHGGPWIGIGDVQPNSAGFARWAGLATDKGVVIMSVVDQSPASKAGLQPADVILSIDGTPVANAEEQRAAILKHNIGDNIQLSVSRGRKEMVLNVVAGTIPR